MRLNTSLLRFIFKGGVAETVAWSSMDKYSAKTGLMMGPRIVKMSIQACVLSHLRLRKNILRFYAMCVCAKIILAYYY